MWGAYSRPPMPVYAVVIAQMASINTPTIRRLLRWTVPAFRSSADPETWMRDCHWLISRDLCVYAGVYAAYQINPSPWNGTQTAFAYVCVDTRGDLRRSISGDKLRLKLASQMFIRCTRSEKHSKWHCSGDEKTLITSYTSYYQSNAAFHVWELTTPYQYHWPGLIDLDDLWFRGV